MKLADVSIRRPVFTVMIILALVVLGYSSFNQMNIDLMPDVDFPYVVVQTVYPGAGAEAVETEVSKRIEDAVNPIEGVKHITAQSQEGYSLVLIEFILEKEGQVAAQEVREKVAAIRGDLPQDIEDPVVSRYDPQSQPIISLTVSGDRSLKEITTFTKDNIKKRLESIPGVGAVTLVGGYEREINIYLDIDKMESYEISVDMVAKALQAANLEIPGGRINEDNVEYTVRTMGKLTSVSQFNNIIIDNPHGQPVYLKDIAVVVDDVKEQRSLARVDGRDAITLDISRQSGANTVEVASSIKATVDELQKELPPGFSINIVVDDSTYIEDSIHEILTNIIFGGLLAIFVIFLFLADIRSTIISAVAIPTSIIATFTFMRALGFTLNMMSLMSLSLAVGLLIDDAIVVIENIFRHLDEGEAPFQAAFHGTREIGLAVMATTFSIVVVFLPVAFMSGIVGRFFYQFGMTIAFAVVVSLFVAFSLTPMLSSRFLKKEGAGGESPKFFLFRIAWRLYQLILKAISPWNRFFNHINGWYRELLAWSLRHRLIVILVATATFIFSLWLGKSLGQEFMSVSDRGQVIIDIKTPPGTDLKTTSDRLSEVEDLIRTFDGVELIFTTIGSGQNPVNEGRIFVKLVDASLRPLSAQVIVDSVRQVIAGVPGIEFSVSPEAGMGGGDKKVELSIRGTDRTILNELAHQVQNIIEHTPGTVDIGNTMEEGKPELRLNIDREKANDLALNVYGIASSIQSLVDGEEVTRYKEGDEEYEVRIRLRESDRSSAADVGRLLIASGKDIDGRRNFLVPISHVAQLEKTSAIGKYNRYDRLGEVRVNSNVELGYFSGTIVNQVYAESQKIDMPPGYQISISGEGEIMAESFGHIFTSLILAVIFIYLLLASQFESFFDPFSIMFSLPMSLVGAVVGMLIFKDAMSIITLIGIIMLMGLVTKNAILLVDFVKQNRRKGMGRTEAILKAGPIRLRPILMTTFAMVFGMLPLALGIGPGAEMRAPMARAVIGGLTSSTLLTLVVVPIVYTIIDDIVAFFMGRETIQPEKEELNDDGSIDYPNPAV
nr:efflux RND transporter permease subunit [candidate division Zixibacteria bacterium]